MILKENKVFYSSLVDLLKSRLDVSTTYSIVTKYSCFQLFLSHFLLLCFYVSLTLFSIESSNFYLYKFLAT